MPVVKLHYGPYEAYGVIKHRPQRLHGLLKCLSEKKYLVELVPSIHLNRLTVEMRGTAIFQCDIRNLLFNMECEDDVVCKRVMDVIEEAESRMYAERNIPSFVSVKEGKRYLEKYKTLTTRDYLSPSVELLYEHQEHLRADKLKLAETEDLLEDRRISIHYTLSDVDEDKELSGSGFDAYSDWNYISNLLRSSLNDLPEDH